MTLSPASSDISWLHGYRGYTGGVLLRRTISILIVLAIFATATVQFWISSFIYRPTKLDRPDPRSWGLSTSRLVSIPSTDGVSLAGWWAAPRAPGRSVVLIVHGRSANVSTRAPIMRRLVADGFGVLMFDYRGYGASDCSTPSEVALREDTVAAYGWLRRQGIPSGKLIVVGQSLGNAPASYLAATMPVSALVLISPFTSLPGAAVDYLPWLLPLRIPWTTNRFDVATNVARLRTPVLLIASRNDGLVPIANARKIIAVARHGRWLDASPLPHDGMLGDVASDGRLTTSLRSLGVTTERL